MVLLPNNSATERYEIFQWIEKRYSHRYFCHNHIGNIETDSAVDKCTVCGSTDITLLEERKPVSNLFKLYLRYAGFISQRYAKFRWPVINAKIRLSKLKHALVV